MKKAILYKIVTFVSREELDFLDKVIKDIYFSTGKKVPRAEILREIIQLAKDINKCGADVINKLTQAAKEPQESRVKGGQSC